MENKRTPQRGSFRNPREEEMEQQLQQFELFPGKTVGDFEREGKIREEEWYLEAFARGIAQLYMDARCEGEWEAVRARPDGGEDLVQLHPEAGSQGFIRELKPAGEGRYAYLLRDPRFQAFKRRFHGQ